MELLERIRRISKHGLVEVGMALLEKVCHWGVGFEVSKAYSRYNLSLSLCL